MKDRLIEALIVALFAAPWVFLAIGWHVQWLKQRRLQRLLRRYVEGE